MAYPNDVPRYIRFRRDDSEMWELRNPVLRDGEPGYETDSRRIKVGDGRTEWNDLPYIGLLYGSSLEPPNTPSRIRSIKVRRDQAQDWTNNNPILLEGEPGYEMDTRKIKIGDGVTPWNSLFYLSYSSSGSGEEPPSNLLEHVNSPTPHPAYDDGLSFSILYQNAKV